MSCTPYPATFPCASPVTPPVHIDPYRPTPPLPTEIVGRPVETVPGPNDELRLDRAAASVPEPSVVLLTVIALATLWRARRFAR